MSKHFTELLVKVDKGEISIPTDDWLTEQGFSPFYRERMEEIVNANGYVNEYKILNGEGSL